MHFDKFSFGSVQIDGSTYEHDVVIDCGEVSKTQEKAVQEVPRRVREAERRKIKLLALPTLEALKVLEEDPKDTNAILHVTC
jgi:hypothetical protein